MFRKIIFLFCFPIFLCPLFSAEPVRSYEDQISFIHSLGSGFTKEIIGTVEYSGKNYPIYKITYGKFHTTPGKRYLIISGVHGNEPAPVFAVKDFILQLDAGKKIIPDTNIDFIYILNPWGFEYNQRYNGLGNDLNRDLLNRSNREIQLLLNSIKDAEYQGVFDFHEANSKGFFLYCYRNKKRSAAKALIQMLKENHVTIDNSYKDNILTVKDGILYIPFYAKIYMFHKNTITTGLYFDDLGIPEVFTFETSKNMQTEERKRIIMLLLDHVFK